jgi:hypothetical protein
MRNDIAGVYAETLARRGGNWIYTSAAGVFSLRMSEYRSNSYHYVGARPAFVEAL